MGDERRIPEGYRLPADDSALLAECRVDTFRAGGPGGQHQNTSETGVRLTHLPTGLSATARDSRSQHRNRAVALSRLRDAIERALHVEAPRKKATVPRAEKERRLREKRRRSETRRLRRKPDPQDPEA